MDTIQCQSYIFQYSAHNTISFLLCIVLCKFWILELFMLYVCDIIYIWSCQEELNRTINHLRNNRRNCSKKALLFIPFIGLIYNCAQLLVFFFIFEDLLYLYVFMSECTYISVHVCSCPQILEEHIEFLSARVTENFEWSYMGTINLTK